MFNKKNKIIKKLEKDIYNKSLEIRDLKYLNKSFANSLDNRKLLDDWRFKNMRIVDVWFSIETSEYDISVPELAKRMNISRTKAYKLVKSGSIIKTKYMFEWSGIVVNDKENNDKAKLMWEQKQAEIVDKLIKQKEKINSYIAQEKRNAQEDEFNYEQED